MKIRKSIGYCLPGSRFAKELGKHGYFVEQRIWREDDTWSPPYIAQGHDVFDSADDPDLLALFAEHDGVAS